MFACSEALMNDICHGQGLKASMAHFHSNVSWLPPPSPFPPGIPLNRSSAVAHH